MTAAWIYWLIAVAWLSFIPNLYLLLRGIPYRKKPYPVAPSLPQRFIVQVTTVGGSPEVVDGILDAVRGYATPVPCETWVLTEEADRYPYRANRIVRTPKDYITPERALRKTRALCYAREVRVREGIDLPTTRILFLDDDSLPTEAYVVAAQRIDADIAHGAITIRKAPGGNSVVYAADAYRSSDCVMTCPRYCTKGKVKVVHGEGMVATGEVEKAIGWDYGPGIQAEDLLFGRKASLRFRYGYIPECLYISSPTTVKDLFKQRRRWYWATFRSRSKLDGRFQVWLGARWASASVGFLAAFFMIYVPAARIILPTNLFIVTLCCLVGFFFSFGYGSWLNTRNPWEVVKAIILTWPACFVEGGIFVGGLIFRPHGFDVVKKALPTHIGGVPAGASVNSPARQRTWTESQITTRPAFGRRVRFAGSYGRSGAFFSMNLQPGTPPPVQQGVQTSPDFVQFLPNESLTEIPSPGSFLPESPIPRLPSKRRQ
jgi:Glycosyl transferase family group 2